MSENNYPKHPGQTEIAPFYVQIPQLEYEALKAENKSLHALLQGAPKQQPNAEIDTLTSEVKALREMNIKAQQEIATLKENQRWRNFKDELPEHHQWIEACFCEYRVRRPKIDIRRWDNGMKYDVFDQELYIGWRPLPKAPEGK